MLVQFFYVKLRIKIKKIRNNIVSLNAKKKERNGWNMEKKQKINCTVESCKYNNGQEQLCRLNSIIVTPKLNVGTSNPDESECSSYESE